ncbi:MAG: fatty acid desaturase [Bacteroidota bacterium]
MIDDKVTTSQSNHHARELMKYTGHTAMPTLYLFIFSFCAYIFFSVSGAMHWTPLWVVSIANTILAYLLFTPLHEAGHQNIKGRNRNLSVIENAIGWLSGLTLMAPFPMFRYLHNLHHKHTNDPKHDPDFWVASRNYVILFVKCFTIYFEYIIHYILLIPQLSKEKKARKELAINSLSFILMIALIVYSGITFGWVYPLFIVVLPAIIALAFLAFAFDWLPHHPHAVRQRYLDTRIILKPGLTTLLVSQNMHLIHHLYSGIPYYHYADAYDVLKEELIKKGANIEG